MYIICVTDCIVFRGGCVFFRSAILLGAELVTSLGGIFGVRTDLPMSRKKTHITDEFAGFCYIESWGGKKFVANSGLIVVDKFRGHGLAKAIKKKAFELSRELFPKSKIFGLTTGLAVMKINSDLGYKPVTFSELTDDDEFWKGCQSCVNYDILLRTKRKHCLCTGMLYTPPEEEQSKDSEKEGKHHHTEDLDVVSRWVKFKQFVLLKKEREEPKDKKSNKKNILNMLFSF